MEHTKHSTKPVAIYKITNTVNGKVYIGQTVTPRLRWTNHKSDAKRGLKGSILRDALRKYGPDAFNFEVVVWCQDKAYADMVEISLIAAYDSRNTGYNTCVGGGGCGSGVDNPVFGRKHSEESLQKMRDAQGSPKAIARKQELRGRPLSEEHRAKIAAANTGKTHTEETKAKLAELSRNREITQEELKKRSESWKNSVKSRNHIAIMSANNVGSKRSEETKAKMSAAQKGKKRTREQVLRMSKPVVLTKGEDRMYFSSIADASRFFGGGLSAVTNALRRGHKVGGWEARYL